MPATQRVVLTRSHVPGNCDLDALRLVLDGVPGRPSAATPTASRAGPVASTTATVWAVPRPAFPVLARAQWRGLGCFALALACLWYLDLLTTSWALQHGAVEGGPVAKFLLSHSMLPLLVAKTVGLGIIVLLAAVQVARQREGLARWSLGAVGAISIGIVEWNLLGILTLAGVLS